MMKAPHSHSYQLLSALLFFFFVTWSSSGSLLSIWLHQEVGLKAGDTGIIYAVLSVSALFAQVCYGFIQDKLGLRKHLLWYITALLILSGPAYLLFGHLLKINVLLGSIFGGIYIGLTFNGGIGVLESYTERVARQSQFEFGRARMWGSLGWAVATFFAGLLFNINPQLNFLVASCSGLVFFILLARLRVSSAPHAMQEAVSGGKVTLEDALRLLTLPRFWALVFFVIGTCIYGVYDQQFPVYFSSQFATLQEGNEMYGYLNSFQVFLEAAGMFCAPWLVNRIGAKNGLIFAGMVMAMRIVASGLVEGPLLISITKLLHAVELPILLVAIFKYNSLNFDKRLSSTLYLVGFACTSSIIASVLSPLAGYSYEKYGFAQSYLIMGLLVFCTTFISTRILFGKGAIEKLREQIPAEARVLITYGGGSVKKTGVLDQVLTALNGLDVLEFGGIEPNPSYETLMNAVKLAREEKVTFLLAVGGGSVLDGTKFIAAAAHYDADIDPWEILETYGSKIASAIPMGSVLTLPATGSESNKGAVISRKTTGDKRAFMSSWKSTAIA